MEIRGLAHAVLQVKGVERPPGFYDRVSGDEVLQM
jgi:hypothetical protein